MRFTGSSHSAEPCWIAPLLEASRGSRSTAAGGRVPARGRRRLRCAGGASRGCAPERSCSRAFDDLFDLEPVARETFLERNPCCHYLLHFVVGKAQEAAITVTRDRQIALGR